MKTNEQRIQLLEKKVEQQKKNTIALKVRNTQLHVKINELETIVEHLHQEVFGESLQP